MTKPQLLIRFAALLLVASFCNTLHAQELKWARSAGTATTEKGYCLTTDDSSNVYTFGTFSGTADLDPGAGTFNLTAVSNGKSFFIQKLDSAGNFKWAVSFGSTSVENTPGSITLDKMNNVLVTGKLFGLMDADPGAGSNNINGSVVGSSFTIKFNGAAEFIWARIVPGYSGNLGTASAVDDSCNVYIVGDFFGSVDFDPGAGTFLINAINTWDVFFQKLDSAGNFMWAERIGAAMIDACTDVEVDSLGNFYACGRYGDMVDVDPGPGVYNLPGGNINLFVVKCDRNGNFLAATGTTGQLGDVFAKDLVLDEQKNIYLTGRFHGTVDFNTDAATLYFNAGATYDSYLLKLDSACTFQWAKQLKSTGANVYGFGVDVDTAGNVYTVGSFSDSLGIVLDTGTHFLVTGETEINGFIIKRNSAGNMIWAYPLTGTDSNAIMGVHVDDLNSIYTTGYFSGTVDFDLLTTTDDLVSGGTGDLFVQKLRTDSTITVSVPLTFRDNNTFIIYPNPSTGVTNIMAEPEMDNIVITDVVGKKVYEASPLTSRTSITILTPGIYFVTISCGDQIGTQKLVVN